MKEDVVINGREISSRNPPYIVAEISANHNGSIDRALKSIKAAKDAGADAVKFQTYTPDTMTIESNSEDFLIKKGLWKGRILYDLYAEAFTPFEWHERLFAYAKELGITIFSSPFDESAVDLLESLDAPAYKIASFELVDLPLISYVAKKNKPMLMSTGMATLEEIGEAIEIARMNGCNSIAIFHCISSYPAPLDQANLNMIKILKREFDVEVGLSDHTLGNLASIVATSIGATLIEKHFTLSRDDGGVDSEFSIEPEEMKALAHDTKGAYDALGDGIFRRTNLEEENKSFRRSLYFVTDLAKGDTITHTTVRRIRPGFGLSPKFLSEVIGKKVVKNVSRGDRVTKDIFE